MAKKAATPKKKVTAAKVKESASQRVTFAIDDTVDLAGDAKNPRKISDKAALGLRNSIKRFGDLSGLVWNVKTRELVCGHQRMKQIRAEYGDKPIEVLDAAAGLGCIRIDATHVFGVRIVDWSLAKQRAANVAANNQRIAGEYDKENLATYLLEIASAMQEEDPGLMDDVLLTELVSDLADLTNDGEGGGNQGVDFSFEVIVACRDEKHQREIHDKLHAEGLTVKCLTL